LDYVRWTGKHYRSVLKSKTQNFNAYVYLKDATTFEEELQTFYYNMGSRSDIISTSTDTERNGTVYILQYDSGEQTKSVLYSIGEGERTLYIVERYENLGSTPMLVKIWGNDNGKYVYTLIELPATRPTMDELKAFGIREYVETAAE